MGFVEKFDAFLRLVDLFKADVACPVFNVLLSVDVLDHVLKLDGNDLARLAHLFLELFFGDFLGDVPHVDVGLEGLLHLLVDLAFILVLLVIVGGDELADEDDFTIDFLLRVKSVHGGLSLLVSFEADESAVATGALNLGAQDFSELLEKISELLIRVGGWNVFDEKVGEVFSSVTSLVLLGVDQNLQLLVIDFRVVHLIDGFLGTVLVIKLDVTVALGGALFGGLDLAGHNFTELLEHVEKALLGNVFWHVFDQNISIGVPVSVFLLIEHDLLTVESGVVHLFKAFQSLLL